jgi:hypothetical protein
VAGCAHTDLPPVTLAIPRGLPVTSNVGQNYPYTSETEAQRREAIDALVAARADLAKTIAAETTPLDDNERWWVWKCPTTGCPGLLHVAGYAHDNHALFVVCDGTCAKTFFR